MVKNLNYTVLLIMFIKVRSKLIYFVNNILVLKILNSLKYTKIDKEIAEMTLKNYFRYLKVLVYQ